MTKRRSSRASAGFTLVELMVALVISGVVIGAMYSVGSASSRHFQTQHQVANMQSALRFAMMQVKRDVMRAGFLATPLDARNSRECQLFAQSTNISFGGTGWMAGISSFRNNVLPNDVDPTGNNAANGFTHDEITLIGNYATSNEYPGVEGAGPGSNTLTLTINPITTWHALLTDFGWDANGAATPVINAAIVQQVFPRFGLIRLETANGRRHYATLQAPAVVAGNTISMTFAPVVPNTCDMAGGRVAPLQVIRYGAALSAAGTVASDRFDTQIAQLVRTQRQATNMNLPMPGSVSRVVLDYLASFNLAFTMSQATGPGNADLYTIGANSADRTDNPVVVNNDPDRIRAIALTLSVRAPSTDPGMRFFNCANLQCFQISAEAGPGGAAARVRTLRSEIFLPNIAYEGY
jgi:prepilin-type N-terminal cleavage/methylation domain-containing protein